MVESGKSAPAADLYRAVDRLLQAEVDGARIVRMVEQHIATVETPPETDGDVIYEPGNLPDGLIDLPSACKEYQVNLQTANGWLQRGLLKRRGKLHAPGGVNVVSSEEFASVVHQPKNKGGRPPKPS